MIWVIFTIWAIFAIFCGIMDKKTENEVYAFLFFVSFFLVFYVPVFLK